MSVADTTLTEPMRAALVAAFGDDGVAVSSVAPLAGGLSGATTARVTVNGSEYVVRQAGPRGSVLSLVAPQMEQACMHLAAARGIAPRVVHASAESGVTIIDFIAGTTFAALGAEARKHRPTLATLLRKLHTGPAFPRSIPVARVTQEVVSALREKTEIAPHVEEHLSCLPRIEAALVAHVIAAPCHYDVNPGNILLEGERVWLVDWELACMGDPFHDLATATLFGPPDAAAFTRFLAAYFDRAATAIEHACFALARVRALTLLALMFTHIAHAVGDKGDEGEGPPSPHTQPRRFAAMLFESAVRERSSPAFAAALATLKREN